MKPLNVDVINIKYRRPGLTKVEFVAEYPQLVCRGIVIYDVIEQKFLTHTHDVELLAAICISLQQPTTRKAS